MQREIYEKQRKLTQDNPMKQQQQTIKELTKIATDTGTTIPKQTVGSDNVCPVCCGAFKKPVLGRCGHLLCEECCSKLMHPQKCPVCRQPLEDIRKVYGINLMDEEDAVEAVQKSKEEREKILRFRLTAALNALEQTNTDIENFLQIQQSYMKTKNSIQTKILALQMESDKLDVDYSLTKNKASNAAEKQKVIEDLVFQLEGELKRLQLLK